jgi:hypothetical protein
MKHIGLLPYGDCTHVPSCVRHAVIYALKPSVRHKGHRREPTCGHAMHDMLGHAQRPIAHGDGAQQWALEVHCHPGPMERAIKALRGLGLTDFASLHGTEDGIQRVELHLRERRSCRTSVWPERREHEEHPPQSDRYKLGDKQGRYQGTPPSHGRTMRGYLTDFERRWHDQRCRGTRPKRSVWGYCRYASTDWTRVHPTDAPATGQTLSMHLAGWQLSGCTAAGPHRGWAAPYRLVAFPRRLGEGGGALG